MSTAGLTVSAFVLYYITTEYGYGKGAPKPGCEGRKGGSRSKSGAVPQL